MWEFSVALSASIAVFCVVIKPGIHALPAVGGVVQSMVVVLLLGSLLFFSSATDPLVPALQSERILALHVGFMLASYGALSLSFGAGLVRLLQGDRARIAALPPAQALDRLSHVSVVVAFPLLTVGILLGAYWANDAWGRYWAWDPKETAALVTWFIYAAYLHVHRLPEWRGTRSAAILIAGYAAVMFTYFGVNLWISGLHSYA
jgi:cytochrome c-type biogenesis protein CcsB